MLTQTLLGWTTLFFTSKHRSSPTQTDDSADSYRPLLHPFCSHGSVLFFVVWLLSPAGGIRKQLETIVLKLTTRMQSAQGKPNIITCSAHAWTLAEWVKRQVKHHIQCCKHRQHHSRSFTTDRFGRRLGLVQGVVALIFGLACGYVCVVFFGYFCAFGESLHWQQRSIFPVLELTTRTCNTAQERTSAHTHSAFFFSKADKRNTCGAWRGSFRTLAALELDP
jgi:hypothetical protein